MKTLKPLPLLILIVLFVGANKSFPQVTDKDGNTYKTVIIDVQEWMSENLNVEHYRNGDPIPQVTNSEKWATLTTGAWCYYDHKTENGSVFGKLYNWYAVTDPRGLAPEGWHIPSVAEVVQLEDFLGGKKIAGDKMKYTTLWGTMMDGNTKATDESGFSALPGGFRDNMASGYYVRDFSLLNRDGLFWTSSKRENKKFAWCYHLVCSSSALIRDGEDKLDGLSVRCIKD